MKEKIIKLFKSKLARNGIWLILLQGFNTIVPILTLPYITRILSKSGYGDFALALNWVGYFQVIVEYGFGLTGARKVATRSNDKSIEEVHSNIIFARIILIVICYSILGTILLFAPMTQSQLFCTLLLSIMIIAIAFQQNWFFQGIQKMQNIAIVNIVSRIISVVLIFLLVKKPEDLYLYCILYVSNYVISSIFGCLIVRYKYKIKLKFHGIKKIINELKDGWYLFISSALTKIFGTVGATILGLIATNEDVATYAAINKIPYILILLFSAISQAIYPHMCQSFEKSKEIGKKQIKTISRPILIFFSLLAMILIIFNKPIVHIAFGEQYENDSLLLIPFCIWVIISIVNNFLGIQMLVASGHQKEYSKSFMISVIIMLLLMFILGPTMRSYGIAIAQAVSEIILTIILIYFIKSCWKNKTTRSQSIKTKER